MSLLSIKNLGVSIDGKKIIKDVNIEIKKGEIHALMGPNGTGKSTLINGIFNNPAYEVSGSVKLNGEELVGLPTDEIAKKGLFMSFQHPVAIEGVSITNFLRLAYKNRFGEAIGIKKFKKLLDEATSFLKIEKKLLDRYLNVGFSGGEMKKMEILQMFILRPEFAILDEIDSGLDIDAVKIVAEGVRKINEKFGTGILVITHYQRILNFLKPDRIHILYDGRIIMSDGPELALKLEEKGYDWVKENAL